MSDNNTLAAITISDWQCEVSGGAPDGFSVPAPTVETVTDENGDFEISTVKISFSGQAQYGTHAFSLNYSFKLSSGENLVDLRVSSDDNATLTACGKTASSKLKSPGWARSDWSAARMGVTEVSGTYTNVGGPHNMTATILVIRSLTGKIYGVNFNVSEPDITVTNLYQDTKITVTCSGNAPYGCFGFVATKTFSIPGGNWTKIDVSSDDNAIVNVGNLSASSRIGMSAIKVSDWTESYPETMTAGVTLTNIGGPFSLTLVVTTRRALAEAYFEAELLSADDYAECMALPEEARLTFIQEKNAARTAFGCGEVVYVKFRNIESKIPVEPATDEVVLSGNVISNSNQLATDFEKNTECEVVATISGYFKKAYSFLVKVPEKEEAKDISWEDYTKETEVEWPFDENDKIFAIKCFRVVVSPTDVSFGNLYFWEVGALEEWSGFFKMRNPEDCIHMPSNPAKLGGGNVWFDRAYLSINSMISESAKGYYKNLTEESRDGLDWREVEKKGRKVLEEVIGQIIWKCPVRWSLKNPGKDLRSAAQCISDKKAKNEGLLKTGELSPRLQTMHLNYNTDIDEKKNDTVEDFLDFTIKKDFDTKTSQ